MPDSAIVVIWGKTLEKTRAVFSMFFYRISTKKESYILL